MQPPIHRYNSGAPYRLAAGQDACLPAILDRLASELAVIDLAKEQPTPREFLRCMHREMKIRNYQPPTIKTYLQVATSVMRWLGRPPHHLTREHVRNYLEYLYDVDRSGEAMASHLSAIRTLWDKMCKLDVTLGLETPRRRRKRPVVPSREEVTRLLQACPSMRDTLLLGLMYGTGMRVSEVCRVRWQDIDIDRLQIYVKQGKGNADRHVQLPKQYRELFQRLQAQPQTNQYVFPSENPAECRRNRHLSTRTVQRLVQRACRMTGIQKNITPHSFRHAFATHSFEDGCDIRRIQKILGHVRLDTTTIYIKVATQRTAFASPLDRLTAAGQDSHPQPSHPQSTARGQASAPANSVGKFRIHHRLHPEDTSIRSVSKRRYQITIEVHGEGFRSFLTGTLAQQQRPGYAKIDFPPSEQWQPVIEGLPTQVAARIETPEFYQAIQHQISLRITQAPETKPSQPPARSAKPRSKPAVATVSSG